MLGAIAPDSMESEVPLPGQSFTEQDEASQIAPTERAPVARREVDSHTARSTSDPSG